MAKFSCFSILIGRKKNKRGEVLPETTKDQNHKTLHVRLEPPMEPFESGDLKPTSFTVIEDNLKLNVKVMRSHDPSPVVTKPEPTEVAYEGEDEHEENSSMKRNNSDFDLHSHEGFNSSGRNMVLNSYEPDLNLIKSREIDSMQSGHVSDPGVGKAEIWASSVLKRSCSNLETRQVLRKIADQLPPSKSQSFEELRVLLDMSRGSPASARTRFSADKVMLKKHSSSQVLPSRSRRLWWKLFLWSHRNLHNEQRTKAVNRPLLAALNQQGGYSSDTIEPCRSFRFKMTESPTGSGPAFKGKMVIEKNNSGFRVGSGLWPHNQWVAFSAESSSSPRISRVDEWVQDCFGPESPFHDDGDNGENNSDEDGGGIIGFPPSPKMDRFRHFDSNLPEEILHANSIVHSLNSSSTAAHICGLGLKVVPSISHFSSLKSVNLSSNSIVRVTVGSLPKGLHVLNLSRNKIGVIEGLRELTRLWILDLSYNRISRIGHGLSNCTLIKELYLAGNKISDVEGVHRLLKLTVLDLSFNKMATTKALGQLVANYNSLQALNLLGNPIQSNVSDDQLRKSIYSLLPKLIYLNKQPLKQQRAREVLMDSVAKAALGSGNRTLRRKVVRRSGGGSGSVPSSLHKRSESVRGKGKNNRTSKSHNH